MILLPSVSKEAVIKDLTYFGVDDIDASSIKYDDTLNDLSHAMKLIFDNLEKIDVEIKRRSSKHTSLLFVKDVVEYMFSTSGKEALQKTKMSGVLVLYRNAALNTQVQKIEQELNNSSLSNDDLVEDFNCYAGLKFLSMAKDYNRHTVTLKFQEK